MGRNLWARDRIDVQACCSRKKVVVVFVVWGTGSFPDFPCRYPKAEAVGGWVGVAFVIYLWMWRLLSEEESEDMEPRKNC